MRELQVGDKAIRLLGGTVRMTMIVREIKEDTYVCAAIDKDTGAIVSGGWQFDRKTGVEEDNDLGWGVKFGLTGSFLLDEEV